VNGPNIPLLVPRDEGDLDAFKKGLEAYGAVFAADGTLVDKVDLDDGWFILIISQAQAEALKEQVGLDVECRWRSRHNNCIVYAMKDAIELLDLRHIPDTLTPNKDGNVDIVAIPREIALRLRAVTVDKVGFRRVEACFNEGTDDNGNRVCTNMLIADIDAEQNAVVVRIISGKNTRIIAKLPKRMAEIRDPYLADNYYVAWGEDGRIIAMTTTKYFNAFIEEINNTSGPYWVRDFRNINTVKEGIRVIDRPITAGLDEDGNLVDQYGVLDPINYGKDAVKSLIAIFNWLHKYYGPNQKYAWLNVAFTMAKLITPLIRKVNQEFIDYVIWNRGRGFEGKSTLVNEVLKRLLSVRDLDLYFVVMSGPVNTQAQARTLVALNRLPLILDEQTASLADYAQVLHSAAIGFGVMSIHAPKYGLDMPVRFLNLRPVLVFTNVPFMDYYNNVLVKIGGDRAILRRFIELTWHDEILPMEATEDLPEIKPIYGLVGEVYRKCRDKLMATRNLIQLTEALVDCITDLYPDFALVASATKEWLSEIRVEKDVEIAEAAEAGELRLVQYARRYIQGQVTKAKVLRAILEHGVDDGVIVLDKGSQEDAELVRAGLSTIINSLGISGSDGGVGDLTGIINSTAIDPDLREALRVIQYLVSEHLVIVTFRAKSALVPGMPRRIWGVERGVYSKNGARYVGYRFRLDEVVRNILLGYGE
jgi:hypothetical protein